MTILKALAATVQVPGVNNDAYEKACLDANLDSTAEYASSLKKDVDLAAANVLAGLVISSMQEGGFAFGIAAAILEKRISTLRREWGIPDKSQPAIRNGLAW